MYTIFSSYYGQLTVATTLEKAHELAVMHFWKHVRRVDQEDAKVTVTGGGLKYTIERDVEKS